MFSQQLDVKTSSALLQRELWWKQCGLSRKRHVLSDSDEINTWFSFPRDYWGRIYLRVLLQIHKISATPGSCFFSLFYNKIGGRGGGGGGVWLPKVQGFSAYMLVMPRGQQNSRAPLLKSTWKSTLFNMKSSCSPFPSGSFLPQLFYLKKWSICNSLILV